MPYWLDALRNLAPLDTGSSEHGSLALALVVGDPLALAAAVLERGDYQVIRLRPSLGAASRLWHRRPHDNDIEGHGSWLPFQDGVFATVVLHEIVEYAIDDRRCIEEAIRVLQPGGTLILRVPARGPLAWLDSLNAYRYIHEMTRRGSVLPETSPIGFRRRFDRNDIDQLLRGISVNSVKIDRTGIPVLEAAHLFGLLSTHLITNDRVWSQGVRRAYARYGDGFERLPGGSWWVVRAQRDDPNFGPATN